jgi:superfamily I DNA and RNA helicase
VLADGADQRAALEELLEELLRQGIQPGRIAVVTVSGKTKENSLFHPRRIGKFVEYGNPQLDAEGNRIPAPPDELPDPDPTKVYFDSVRRIKGLERGVVILVDVPHPGEIGSEERRLLYAAATRATTYLAVIGPADRLGALKVIADGYRP